jgi:hypothetical protein
MDKDSGKPCHKGENAPDSITRLRPFGFAQGKLGTGWRGNDMRDMDNYLSWM